MQLGLNCLPKQLHSPRDISQRNAKYSRNNSVKRALIHSTANQSLESINSSFNRPVILPQISKELLSTQQTPIKERQVILSKKNVHFSIPKDIVD